MRLVILRHVTSLTAARVPEVIPVLPILARKRAVQCYLSQSENRGVVLPGPSRDYFGHKSLNLAFPWAPAPFKTSFISSLHSVTP